MLLYSIGIKIYGFLIRLAAPWNPKAAAMIAGRKITAPASISPDLIWIHCASLGEFEMAKPIAAALQAAAIQRQILFSFFSPSGYQNATLEPNQIKCYLPLDGPGNAKRWLAQWKPSIAIFIRYEFWYYYIKALTQNQIPTYALGVSLRPKHFLFSIWGKPWLKLLQRIQGIGVINLPMLHLAQNHQLQNAFVFGDPKFNRAVERAANPNTNLPIELNHWLKSKPTIIFGSSWPKEEELLMRFLEQSHVTNPLKGWNILIAPHDISKNRCQQIIEKFQKLDPKVNPSTKYNIQSFSDFNSKHPPQILILNTIGMLAQCYRFGKIAVIGGAFGNGLHNILEPAAFGMPILFGPNHHKFPEAQQFIDAGFANSFNISTQFNQILNELLSDQNEINRQAILSKSFTQNQQANIIDFVSKL